MDEQDFFAEATDILNKHLESNSVKYFINDMEELFNEWDENKEPTDGTR